MLKQLIALSGISNLLLIFQETNEQFSGWDTSNKFLATYFKKGRPCTYISEERKNLTMLKSSMIHSARPTISQVAITILIWKLFCIERFWNLGTDVRTKVQTPLSKITITSGRDFGSAEWIKRKILLPNLTLISRIENGHSWHACSNEFEQTYYITCSKYVSPRPTQAK